MYCVRTGLATFSLRASTDGASVGTAQVLLTYYVVLRLFVRFYFQL